MSNQPDTSKPKKMVGMGAIAALLIVVVLLGAALGYVYYSDTNTINSKDKAISSLNTEMSSKNSTMGSLNSTITSLNSQITTLNSEKANLQAQLSSSNTTKASLQSQISSLDNQLGADNETIATIQLQVAGLENMLNVANASIASLQTQIGSLDTQISNLESQVSSLEQITSLGANTYEVNDYTISQAAGYYTYWTLNFQYAGYVEVDIQSSTTTNTYAIVKWSADGISYDKSITVGQSGLANFPVLPSSSVTVGVGNSNLISGATETVTVIYFY